MRNIRQISVEGLFGLYDHEVTLRTNSAVTIVAGPNGVGKTTLLKLASAFMSGDLRQLLPHKFTALKVTSVHGVTLVATPIKVDDESDEVDSIHLERWADGKRTETDIVELTLKPEHLPSYIEPFDDDHFHDVRDGEILSARDIQDRYGLARPSVPKWFSEDRLPVDFIETKRLDTLIAAARATSYRRRRPSETPIEHYLSAVADRLEAARRESARIYQSRTRSVARRLLGEYSRKAVNADRLRDRYADVVTRASAITKNGLLSDALDVLPDEHLNPTQKRFFELFLDDFEAKIAPLTPISARVDVLRNIVRGKFLNKRMVVDADQGILFLSAPHGDYIAASSLSSGEQHELALVSRLLFNEDPGTTVFVDEPELSLHVSWQHEMVNDLQDIAKIADLTFVIATHSTAIINGRWELVEELGPSDSGWDGDEKRA